MANTKINSFTTMLSFFIIFIFILTGCTGTIQNLGVSMMPTYQEVVDSWPEIEEGKGRAVFYFVKQEGSNLIAAFLDLMIDLQDRLKTTMIAVTHDLAVIRLLAGRAIVMKNGRIIEAGLTDQILEDPRHAYTQRLVASAL